MGTIIITTGQLAIISYFAMINLVAFFIFGLDKAKSGHIGKRRISERALWFIALLGGSIGSLLGMYVFRHKTKKLSFQAMLAFILALQILLVWLIFFR